jgi:hypothetical protein
MANISTLGSLITNDARRTREIKSRIPMAKAAFNKKKTFRQQTGLLFKEKTSKVLHLERSFVWCQNLDTSENRSEIYPEKFSNTVLEKVGEDSQQRCTLTGTQQFLVYTDDTNLG